MERLSVFHGTMRELAEKLRSNHEDLIGRRFCRFPGCSGNLTLSIGVAKRLAGISDGGKEETAIMRFLIPVDELRYDGEMKAFNALDKASYSTTLKIDAVKVPQTYLETIHLSRRSALTQQKSGLLEFYRVPIDYLAEIIK